MQAAGQSHGRRSRKWITVGRFNKPFAFLFVFVLGDVMTVV
jgi:hypothetical protein